MLLNVAIRVYILQVIIFPNKYYYVMLVIHVIKKTNELLLNLSTVQIMSFVTLGVKRMVS